MYLSPLSGVFLYSEDALKSFALPHLLSKISINSHHSYINKKTSLITRIMNPDKIIEEKTFHLEKLTAAHDVPVSQWMATIKEDSDMQGG